MSNKFISLEKLHVKKLTLEKANLGEWFNFLLKLLMLDAILKTKFLPHTWKIIGMLHFPVVSFFCRTYLGSEKHFFEHGKNGKFLSVEKTSGLISSKNYSLSRPLLFPSRNWSVDCQLVRTIQSLILEGKKHMMEIVMEVSQQSPSY